MFVRLFGLAVLFRVFHRCALPINALKALNVSTHGGQETIQCGGVILAVFFNSLTLFRNCLRLLGVVGLAEVSEFDLFKRQLLAFDLD